MPSQPPVTAVRVTDKHFREWEQDAFGYGYGTGEAFILPVLHTFLGLLEDGRSYTSATLEDLLGEAPTWFLLNVLCKTHIVEYGTSPRYGWLTPCGERLRAYCLSKTPEELYDIVTAEVEWDAPLCSRVFCQCADGIQGQGCRHNPLWQEACPSQQAQPT